MRKAVIILTIVAVFSLSCKTSTDSNNRLPIRPETPPILEIVEDRQGMWDITGKDLFFRLYDNGYAEFEWIDKPVSSTSHKTAEVAKLLTTQVDVSKMAEYRKLLNSANSFDSKYKRKCCCTDAQLNYSMLVAEKTVKLSGFCSVPVGNELIGTGMPKELARLFEIADSDREKRIYAELSPR